MGIDIATPVPEAVWKTENPSLIDELIAAAETIPQIIAIARRIKHEQPSGTEWADLKQRARLILDGYIYQVQADPNQLSRLRQEVTKLIEINLFDDAELKTYTQRLNATAAKTGQVEMLPNQLLLQSIQSAETISQLPQLITKARAEATYDQLWLALKAQARKIIGNHVEHLKTHPDARATLVTDLSILYGETLFNAQELQDFSSQLYRA